MFYADITLGQNALLPLPVEYEERAAYVVEGSVHLTPNTETFNQGQLLVFKPGAQASLLNMRSSPARVILLGGEPMDGPRHIWWNFVSSSAERIEQAKADWKAGRFAPVPDETTIIPLPESGPAVVHYP
jgi:redox-sensitive bicupin YhaK (pirin superfamily)